MPMGMLLKDFSARLNGETSSMRETPTESEHPVYSARAM